LSTKKLRYHIIESLKLLASEGEIQLECFPDYVCKPDEIANSLGDWLLLYNNQMEIEVDYAFSSKEILQIISIDDYISTFSPEEFTENSILNSYKWREIRDMAMKTLILLKEEYTYPDAFSI